LEDQVRITLQLDCEAGKFSHLASEKVVKDVLAQKLLIETLRGHRGGCEDLQEIF